MTVLCHMGDFGCGHGGWTPVMKINGNKVPCGIDFLSIACRDRPLERYFFFTGADWLIDNEGDFCSLFMSPADISLTKGKDTLCQMGWEGGIVSNFLKTIRIIRWKIKKPIIKLYHIINYSPRVPSASALCSCLRLTSLWPSGQTLYQMGRGGKGWVGRKIFWDHIDFRGNGAGISCH